MSMSGRRLGEYQVLLARTRIVHWAGWPSAYDRVTVIVVRDGSALL